MTYYDLINYDKKYDVFKKVINLPQILINIIIDYEKEVKMNVVFKYNKGQQYKSSDKFDISIIYDSKIYNIISNAPITQYIENHKEIITYDGQIILHKHDHCSHGYIFCGNIIKIKINQRNKMIQSKMENMDNLIYPYLVDHCAVICHMKNSIYSVAQHYSLSKKVYKLCDKNNAQWIQIDDLHFNRSSPSCIAIDDKLYVIGGDAENKDGATMEYYEKNKGWNLCIGKMNTFRKKAHVVILYNKIYIIGGICYVNGKLILHNNIVEKYDFEKQTWAYVADHNQLFCATHQYTFIHNNKIIICEKSESMCGKCEHYPEMYDPILNTWSILKTNEFNNVSIVECNKQSFLQNIT